MKNHLTIKRTVLLAGALLMLPALASAYDGLVTANVNLRAGPDVGYPAVILLPSGSPVSIYGCLDGWTWCDVSAGPNRGWVAGTFVQNDYRGQRVIVTDFGSQIGIPLVTFSLGSYWDSNYRARPWYRERSVWANRRFSHAPPPRPRAGGSHARVSPGVAGKVIERNHAAPQPRRDAPPSRSTLHNQAPERAHIPRSTPSTVINRTPARPTPDKKKDERDRR